MGIRRQLSTESEARAAKVKKEKAKRKIVVPTFKQILNWESWRKRLEQQEKHPINPPKQIEPEPVIQQPIETPPEPELTFQQKIDQHLKLHALQMAAMRDRVSRPSVNDALPELLESYFN